ncbi:MAG TPA: hypothetical protein VNT03_12760, partial [Baekduia sp.]|nr:hypothetical protein [Baekduia sp.]
MLTLQRQAPLAVGALAACAVIATGSILLRERILSFSSWPDARDGRRAPDVVIPHAGLPAAPGTPQPGTGRGLDAPRVAAILVGFGSAAPGVGRTLGPHPARSPSGGLPAGATGPSVTTTGPSGSSHPSDPGGDPLSTYAGLPVTGDAAPVSGSTAPVGGSPVGFIPTVAATRTAAPEAASVAPAADPTPVVSSADNAPPPPDPTGAKSPAPAAAPAPEPAPGDPDPVPVEPSPAPAQEAPPADPVTPVDPSGQDTPPADPPA